MSITYFDRYQARLAVLAHAAMRAGEHTMAYEYTRRAMGGINDQELRICSAADTAPVILHSSAKVDDAAPFDYRPDADYIHYLIRARQIQRTLGTKAAAGYLRNRGVPLSTAVLTLAS